MELKNYFQWFKKIRFILLFALVVALAAGTFSWFKEEKYSASLSILVSRLGTQQAADYKYDSYYALRATDEFGETIVGWLKTPEIASAVYQKAGISSAPESLAGLSRKFKAFKASPNLVEIRYGSNSEDEARKLAQAVGEVLTEKINLIYASSWQGIGFVILPGTPVIVKNTAAVWWTVLAGFLVGLAVGFFVQVAKEHFYC